MNHRLLWGLVVLAFLAWSPPLEATNLRYVDAETGKEVYVIDVRIQQEGLTGLTVLIRGKPVKISPLDVRELSYSEEEVRPLDFLLYRAPLGKLLQSQQLDRSEADKTKLRKEALTAFNDVIAKVPAERDFVKRQLLFQRADTLYTLAQDDPTLIDQALTALNEFRKAYPTGWQVTPTLVKLATLQEVQDDLAGVQQTYKELAAIPGLSPTLRATSLLNLSRALVKSGQYATAENELQALEKTLSSTSIEGYKVKVFLAQCRGLKGDAAQSALAEKDLLTLNATATDSEVKALIHNTLGELYLKRERLDDAFWAFLKVDVQYSNDRFEHARALYHLIRLYREVKKQGERADDCVERLTKDRRFAGLEYQKKARQK